MAATRLPVKPPSGFLGPEKAKALKQIFQNREGRRVAAIVNDMSEVNIDASLSPPEERLVKMVNGCICAGCATKPKPRSAAAAAVIANTGLDPSHASPGGAMRWRMT